jgi:hypothetical protein
LKIKLNIYVVSSITEYCHLLYSLHRSRR